jgi:uncharacterized protein (DUF58 family)
VSGLFRKTERISRLRMTRAGWLIVLIALATGFAALNTGSNLLFLGWGGVLAGIVVSGVLSERTLRSARAHLERAPELRAGQRARWDARVENRARRWPAWGLEVDVVLPAPHRASGAFVAHVEAGAEKRAPLAVTLQTRGLITVERLELRTRFPFGFFEKYRHEESGRRALVYPRRVETGRHATDLLARLGERPAGRRGPGEDLFTLRAFRPGDDPRHVAWRRSARTGRWVVRETEAAASRDLVIVLAIEGAGGSATERAIAFAGSLAEDLLASGHAVGLEGAGAPVAPRAGAPQRAQILRALALVEDGGGGRQRARAARVAVVADGAAVPAGVDAVLRAGGDRA